jgi:hypothetical protein
MTTPPTPPEGAADREAIHAELMALVQKHGQAVSAYEGGVETYRALESRLREVLSAAPPARVETPDLTDIEIDRIGYTADDGDLEAACDLIAEVATAETNGAALASVARFRKTCRMAGARAALASHPMPPQPERVIVQHGPIRNWDGETETVIYPDRPPMNAAEGAAEPKHKPGCDALGGYGHGVGLCSCGAQGVDHPSAPKEWIPKVGDNVLTPAGIAKLTDIRPAYFYTEAGGYISGWERSEIAASPTPSEGN